MVFVFKVVVALARRAATGGGFDLFSFRSLRRPLCSATTPFDYTKRHREEAETAIEDLVEDGWDKKIPKQTGDQQEASEENKVGSKVSGMKKEELDGPKGPEPTRYGDWERAGRCSDF
ncbi:hypothetical protein HOP50_15g75900 [Chloropicon primus]|uniref:Succinate dehydrogenase assembly factor 4, mitochondrial n=1 Tax=Chloropicon primus TaxID=1764295 RepID=A0A5B8MX28_9CHLO|nr:hypothetical protein A3770_15p75650 [Chloropicon primus]UPR04255.1 hypothetical protein HOP50_15g75900 [Chloropicon primus]|eukprot:QDZ25047.1 hypothetical protein A3770_15p75650 [Chloropicon primus]